jgi:hypothetical protein
MLENSPRPSYAPAWILGIVGLVVVAILAGGRGGQDGSGLAGLPILLFLIAAYFIPTIVAGRRHVHDFGMVLVINAFLGWTLIGWVVALALACRTPRPA